MEDHVRSQRLRQFRYVERMNQEKVPVKAKELVLNRKKKGRPKKQ